MSQDQMQEEGWRKVMTEKGIAPQARLFRWLPSNPRCPLCSAPYTDSERRRAPVS